MSEPTLDDLVSGDPATSEAARRMLDGLIDRGVPRRIRERDHTVWRADPREIGNRLGWLDAGKFLRPHLGGLQDFVTRIRDEGYRDIVLLGMGGSCLGPEVLRLAFGPVSGYPRLTMLDSTVPEQVEAVASAIDPSRTLFVVSSKSGGTIETLSFYRYFRGLVEEAAPGGDAGRNFVAITDEGTPLQQLARETNFRRVFVNPADIGGRYSVLSWFGMLPAALAGIDVKRLLDSAATMRDQCLGDDPGANPGLYLGALLGSAALSGRDKVTLIAPAPIEGFGLWVEQMIAESLGKEGRGIVPVAGEPLLDPGCYGDDRLFVFLEPPWCGEISSSVDRLEQGAIRWLASSSRTAATWERSFSAGNTPQQLPDQSWMFTPSTSPMSRGPRTIPTVCWTFTSARRGCRNLPRPDPWLHCWSRSDRAITWPSRPTRSWMLK